MAKNHGATPAQVALAFLLHTSFVTLLIPGTSSLAHLEENVRAASLQLDPDEIAALHEPARSSVTSITSDSRKHEPSERRHVCAREA
jgi:aryl-alcohol dehydrogenase-like predicted oxidoreductase